MLDAALTYSTPEGPQEIAIDRERTTFGRGTEADHRFAFAEFPIRQMGMAVDQTGQHRHGRKFNDFCARRNSERCSNRLDFVASDNDDLIAGYRTLIRLNQPARFDYGHLGEEYRG